MGLKCLHRGLRGFILDLRLASRSERPNLVFERSNLASQWPNLKFERLNLGSGTPDFGSERPDLGS